MLSTSMAAARACIDVLVNSDALAHMQALGQRLIDGLRRVAAQHGQRLKITGLATMPFVRFANESNFARAQVFCGEATRRGAYLPTPFINWFLSATHTVADIDETLDIADHATRVVADRFGADGMDVVAQSGRSGSAAATAARSVTAPG